MENNTNTTPRIVNRHYIGVVKEENCHLKYEEIDIPQDDILIGVIEAMKENENRTILDVQALLTEFFPEDIFNGKYYDYLYPKSYSSAYVNGASYPHIITIEEYKNKLAKKEEWYRSEEYLTEHFIEKEELKLVKNNSTEEEYKAKVEEIVKEGMRDYKKRLREGFSYKDFIFAYRYTEKLREIKNDPNVKMYSTDQIGWKEFEYKVNDDITVYIKTNFGYGNASYFFCNLKYKDINILPYSWPVKYYYVEMIDFIRYTRRYSPRRISWVEVFDFAVETANMAKHEPEKFVKEWIVNEVEEMMKGMRLFMSSPDRKLEDFLGAKKRPKLYELHEVAEYAFRDVIRNCNDRDREEYKALPKEKVIAFKAEKITGSLLLLDNLRKLTEIATIIIAYIAEIEEMNMKLLPEIERHMNNISVDIKQLIIRLDEGVKALEPLNVLFENHKKEIKRLRKEYKDIISEWKAENDYEQMHPEYVQLKEQIRKLTERNNELEKDIKRRENFLKILTKCKNRIDKYVKVA